MTGAVPDCGGYVPAARPSGAVPPLLAVEGLTVGYGASPVLRRASFTISGGEICGIIGPNGAGKSTALRAVLGLLPAQSGTCTLDGRPVTEQRARVAYVPQRSAIDWEYPATVTDVVAMGRHVHRTRWGRPRDRRRDRAVVAEALERVRLTTYADRQIGALSGGQQQRVFLARALAQEADVFLLDEPFAAVDALTEELMWGELVHLAGGGCAVAVVNHDLASVTIRLDRLVILAGRVVAAGPTAEVFTEQNIAAAYGSVPTVVDRAVLPTAAAAVPQEGP